MISEKQFREQYYTEKKARRPMYSCRICGDTDVTKRYPTERICKPCRSGITRTWMKKHPGKARRILFISWLWRKYHIRPDRYMEIYRRQNGKCAICFMRLPLQVDHDHSCCPSNQSCGICVRGLVCGPHNRGMGQFRDNTKHLRSAVDYLERW